MKNSLIKSALAIFLSVVCVFGAVGCSKNTENNDTGNTKTEQTQEGTKTGGLLGGSQADYSYYLKLNGIEGESKNAQHDKWIEVTDFSFGIIQDEYQPIVFTHKVDKATPKLQKCCLESNYISNGELQATKSVAGAQKVILKIAFTRLKIVDSIVEPVTDTSGASYLIEKVTMLTEQETVTHSNEEYILPNYSEYYIQLNGIEGESTDSNHAKWIDVIDFSCGVSKDEYQPIVFTHKVDKATPTLQNRCLSGEDILDGELQATKFLSGSQNITLKIAFTHLKVVDSEIKTVRDANGASYLIEKVSMLAQQQTIIPVEKDNDSSNDSGFYMKIDGIEGACNNGKFEKWIDLTGFSYGAEQEIQTGKPVYTGFGNFKPIVFTHKIDCATSKIQSRCFSGEIISSAEFNATKNIAGKQTVIYKVRFEKVILKNATIKSVTDENGNSYLCEEVSLTAEKEIWTAVTVGMDPSISGTTEAEYDQTKKA